MRPHRHRAQPGEHRVYGWTSCVVSGPCSGIAHGGTAYRDRCSCGATRHGEANGGRAVYGPWVVKWESDAPRRQGAPQQCAN